MKKMKKIVAFLVAMCMVLSMASVAYAEESELGAYDNPWQLSTTSTRFAVYVEPGDTQYVQVDDCNGTVLEVGYVYDEAETYNYMIAYGRMNMYYPDAAGLLSFTMQAGGDMFSVYNAGETALTVYMSLAAGAQSDTTGTMDDPAEIVLEQSWSGLSAYVEQELAAGNQGYYYTYTATTDGLLMFDMYGAVDADWNSVGWMYWANVAKADGTYIYGDTHWSDDEEPVYNEEWEVSAGDVVSIWVSTYDPMDMWNAPVGTVTFTLSLSTAGSWTYPADMVLGDNVTEITEGGNGYYYTWTAEEDGVATITIVDATDSWEAYIDNPMAELYNDPISNYEVSYDDDWNATWTKLDAPVNTQSVEVSAGDVVEVYVNTCDINNAWSVPAGTITVNLSFEAPEAETTPEETTPEETTPEETTPEETTPEEESTEAGETVVTGDVSTTVMIVVMFAAAAAVVLLKKKALN